MLRGDSGKKGQSIFIPYLLLVYAYTFLGAMAKDWYLLGPAGFAALLITVAVIFQFTPAKIQTGYNLVAFSSLILVVSALAKMIKTQNFITSGVLLVFSGAVCYFCFVSLMPSSAKPHMSKAWKEKLDKDKAAKEAERAEEEAEAAKEEAKKAKFADE